MKQSIDYRSPFEASVGSAEAFRRFLVVGGTLSVAAEGGCDSTDL
jgi:hypothetical protein